MIEPGTSAQNPSGTSARILVVDDELGVREGCRKILAAEGYEVVTAGDGKAGLEQLIERGPFAVLLVDLPIGEHAAGRGDGSGAAAALAQRPPARAA